MVSEVRSGAKRFALTITLKFYCSRVHKFATHQVTQGSRIPQFTIYKLTGTLKNITLAPFHSCLKIKKSNGNTGF